MSPDQIIRAWKDPDYAACQLDTSAATPAHPIGPIDIADRALDVSGASIAINRTEYVETLGCCQGFTQAGKCDVTAGFPYCTMGCLTIVMTNAGICS